MITKRDLVVRWTAYTLAALLLLLLREILLHSFTLWGVAPFLPPVLTAIVASQEDCTPGAIFALSLGFICDLTVAAPFPGLYTLSLTLAALVAFFVAERVLQPGILCAFLTTVCTFLVTDLFCMLALAGTGAPFLSLCSLSLRELLVSLLQFPLCYPILRYIHNRCTL